MRYYGLIRDTPDFRDIKYELKPKTIKIVQKQKFPDVIDLRKMKICPDPYNQGPLGSCTGNSIGGALHIDRRKLKLEEMIPSRIFIYYNERDMQGTVMQDSGASLRDGVKSINIYGVPSEEVWPYIISKFTEKPPISVYQKALEHPKILYQRVDNTNLDAIKGVLYEGYPIVFGCDIYSSFESEEVSKTGKVPFPNFSRFSLKPVEEYKGGHAMVIVGYLDKEQVFIVRNSWGEEWGDMGYCYIPYEYLTNRYLAFDFWVMRIIQGQRIEIVSV